MEQNLDNIANELAKEIIQYSVNLPENDTLNLKKKLSLSARLLPSSIRTFNQKKERIDKMKSLIVASSNLSDCKEILEISQRLKYGNVDNITEKINNLDKYLSKNVFF